MADIDDCAKAERYRRLTRRWGTTIVEEIRDGKTRFVQAILEKIFRSRGVPTHASVVSHKWPYNEQVYRG